MSGTAHKSTSEGSVEKGMDGEHEKCKTTATDPDLRRCQTRAELIQQYREQKHM
jgi:hypothetical protein